MQRGHSGERRSAVGPFPPPCLPARFARPRRASAGVRSARRTHAIGRAARVRGALGFRGLMRPADRSRAPVPTRWHASGDARGARLSASEATPAARTPSLSSTKPQPRATELEACEAVARSLLVARGDALLFSSPLAGGRKKARLFRRLAKVSTWLRSSSARGRPGSLPRRIDERRERTRSRASESGQGPATGPPVA